MRLASLALAALLFAPLLYAQAPKVVYTPAEQTIADRIKTLRATPDSERGMVTEDLAHKVQALPGGLNKLRLAYGLANLSTEGDFGHASLQAVTDALTSALAAAPQPPTKEGAPAGPYLELAKLARYEHVTVTTTDPEYTHATATVLQDEREVERADFTLTDLSGKQWTLSSLRGKVVLVNFWATWCPPCRKEMPDLQALSTRFAPDGLVILSLSDEEKPKVATFIAAQGYTYPILLDAEGKTAKAFHVEGIPHSFIFGRDGKLVTQSIDMRTKGQFLAMLAQAGIQ